MSARGFKGVYVAGAVVVATLGCYLVSLNVANERAAVESAERRILLAKREIRSLETEIGTRGRLAQLERWNASVIRLSAPAAEQFAADGFQLATLARPDRPSPMEAPVVLAAAPATAPASPLATPAPGEAAPPRAATDPKAMLHVASYPTRERIRDAARPAETPAVRLAPAKAQSTPAKPAAAKPAAGKPGDSAATKAPAKPAALAKASLAAKPKAKGGADPLAPAPARATTKAPAKP